MPGLKYTDADLIGMRFGKLTVTAVVGRVGWKRKVACDCDCGGQCTRFINALMSNAKRGAASDCGCFRAQHRSTLRHGMYKTKEYYAWTHMRQRCSNENNAKFADYGGRGIRVCQRWDESFEAFYEDMGPAPESTHSVNRIDNDGHYEPGNCEWADSNTQARNKRNVIFIEVEGRRLSLADAADEYGINFRCLRKRIRSGWHVHRALTEPSGTYHKKPRKHRRK